ncbi:MAG: gliding motility-associated lipoprotein GldD [Cyclobacteriaceae bacterium]|jgi:gliding motility-associated lipoprotein GldD
MKYLILVFIFIGLSACNKDYLPRPKGYNRIELPEHAFVQMPDTMPYSFEYSKYAMLKKDVSWISERYWVDLEYPEMGANVQITYKPIMNRDSLIRGYYSDSYRLTAQHNVKAYAIDEMILELPNGDFASVTSLEGEIPTPFQFHVSDSSQHFLRGALYFKTATKNDSLAPVIDYLKADIIHMLETLKWNDLD